MENEMELLAPAGGLKELKAAVWSGADAVYIGASAFSARSGAGNFSEDEMREAVEFAHSYGVNVHCAINTLIKEDELEAAVKTAVMANECGVDALIIQDIGLASHIKKLLPDMELHASTQMTVTSLEGVRYLEEKGFSRVVLARELSKSEIKNIVDGAKAEIEVFVHGAICMCYSGQCLMSSVLGGRSGNRGRCAQPCRLPYELTEKGKSLGSAYALSPKDMSLIDHLSELKEMGVKSLKIEGRLKSAEYVSAVVGVYRKYITSPHTVEKCDKEELKNAFSRSGFTDGYFTDKLGGGMMAHKNPANNSGSIFTKEAKDRADGREIKRIPISIYVSLKHGDVLRATVCDNDGNCAVCEGEITAENAKTRPLDRERLLEQFSKLGSTSFIAEHIEIDVDDGIIVPIKEVNSVRRRVLDELFFERAKRDKKRALNIQLNFDSFKKNNEVYLTAEVRTKEQGEAVLESGAVRRIYAPTDVAEHLSKKSGEVEIVTKTADILTDENISTKSVSVSSTGGIYKYGNKAKYGDYRLNIYNSLSVRELANLDCVTISPELNLSEVAAVTKHIRDTEIELIGYGHLPLMIMKNCPIKAMGKCQNGKNTYSLRDRKNIEFPIVCEKGCRAVLLNSKPIYTADMIGEIKRTGINCIRLNFTVENSRQCGKIIKEYNAALMGGKVDTPNENSFTRGHLRRGVL